MSSSHEQPSSAPLDDSSSRVDEEPSASKPPKEKDQSAAGKAIPPKEGAKELGWILDSGAGSHLCCKRYMFSTYRKLRRPREAQGVGSGAFILGIGTVPLVLELGDKTQLIELKNVRYVPSTDLNLLGVPVFTNLDDHSYHLDRYKGKIVHRDPQTSQDTLVLSGTVGKCFETVGKHFAYLDYSYEETLPLWNFKPPGHENITPRWTASSARRFITPSVLAGRPVVAPYLHNGEIGVRGIGEGS
jgi:hypothetical protein